MAWTSKSDRFDGGAGKVATELNYSAPPSSLHTRAPSFPRATRSLEDKDAVAHTPGAGSYDPPMKQKGHYDHGIPKKNAPFLSSAQRAGIVQDTKSPGPGAYTVLQQHQEKFPSRTFGEAQSEQRQMLKSSSAPSIPQAHQSFGYEEAGGGRLVRQARRDGVRTMTGRPGDSAGPGQYYYDESTTRKCTQPLSFGQAGRDMTVPGETPGPGHYDAKAPTGERPGIARMNPAFASESSRGMTRATKSTPDLPGPGQYALERSRRPDIREIHPELQFFGSTTERFKQGGPSGAPGPGSYDEPLKRVALAAQPFLINAVRFLDKPPDPSPGPGEYRVLGARTEPSGPLGTFSILGNSGGLAFGSMTRRFVPQEKNDDAGPGPGNLAPALAPAEGGNSISSGGASASRSRREIVPRRPAVPTAAFHSQTPKDTMLKDIAREAQTKPPPGAYNPVIAKDVRSVARNRGGGEGFMVAEVRFTDKKADSRPGPGRYSPSPEVNCGKRYGSFNRSIIEGVPQRGRVKGLGFQSHTKRFQEKRTSSPGPGEYKTDPGWITKSYNCYFGDVF